MRNEKYGAATDQSGALPTPVGSSLQLCLVTPPHGAVVIVCTDLLHRKASYVCPTYVFRLRWRVDVGCPVSREASTLLPPRQPLCVYWFSEVGCGVWFLAEGTALVHHGVFGALVVFVYVRWG